MKTRCSAAGRLLGPLFCGLFFFVLLLLDGSAVFQTHAVDVEVKDESNMTCLFAKWMTNFSVTYESNTNEYRDSIFEFPEDLEYAGSSCGNETSGPVLAIQFGEGHSWTIQFSKTEDFYQGSISFTYNTNDNEFFPDAKRKGLITASASYPLNPIALNTVYSCNHLDTVEADNVTQDFWNVTLQAFVWNGSLSLKNTRCDQDNPPTTATTPPTTTTATTTTTTTTPPPTTTTTTPPPTPTTTTITTVATTTARTTRAPTPHPTVPPEEQPVTGNYTIRNGSAICLLASMGLQLNISQAKVPLIMNINPNTTVATGTCGSAEAVLRLNDSNSILLDFVFVVPNTSLERYYLKELNITVIQSSNETLHSSANSLNYWETSLGSSYMCAKHQTLSVTEAYSINTFNVRMQPFLVKDNDFSTAEDCSPEMDNFFVPLMMAVALAGLVTLVLMAYFVGRKKRRGAGYEQF